MGDYEMKAWIEVNRIEVVEQSVYTRALADLGLAKAAVADKKPPSPSAITTSALTASGATPLRLRIHLSLARLYEGRGDLQAGPGAYAAPSSRAGQRGKR